MSLLSHKQKIIVENYLGEFYAAAEFPVLRHQYAEWQDTRPLAGLRVLDVTPIFRNTLAKYLALAFAGADVVLAQTPLLMNDPTLCKFLPNLGFELTKEAENEGEFDVIFDCGGIHAAMNPSLGFVELTRSGMEKFTDSKKPVFLADAGRIKEIETCLGTGESFLRGMAHFEKPSLVGKRLVVFGYGKVGRGIVMYALRAGAIITVIDSLDKSKGLPEDVEFVPLDNTLLVESALRKAFCVVTVTGQRNALVGKVDLPALVNSDTLLANMGVEDEYGDEVPAERVLNRKFPLNFALEEPTLIRYIETIMALDNAGAVELVRGKGTLPSGIIVPSFELENYYLGIVQRAGLIEEELKMAGLIACSGMLD